MENTKKFTIKDMDTEKHFNVRLFSAMEGLDFFDKIVGTLKNQETLSVKPFLKDLLPLATLLDTNGDKPLRPLDLQSCDNLFKNPLAVIQLGIEIMEFQMVFMNDSDLFRPFKEVLQGSLNIKI